MLRFLNTVDFAVIGCLLLTHVSLADQQSLLVTTEAALKQASDFDANPHRDLDGDVDQKTQLEALKHSLKALSEAEAQIPVNPILPKPELFNLSKPSSTFDIDQLSKQGLDLVGRVDDQSDRYETQVLVFVSSSLPDTTVKNYLQQTRRIGSAIVMRGLINDSMADTRAYLFRMLDDDESKDPFIVEPTILIDPTLFDRFDIDQVPVIVVTESKIPACLPTDCTAPLHHKVSGDVSLGWALRLVARQIDSDSLKTTLTPLIKQLETR